MMRGRGYPAGQSFNRGAIAQNVDDGVVLLKHREFIGTVVSSTDFQATVYELNPGLDRTFPWAAGIANQFQQYKIKSMCWEFVSTSATSLVNGTNTALGQVAIATQYDSVNEDFVDLASMLNSQWATSTKISSNLLHPIECEKGQTTSMPQYVRNAPPPPNADIRLYDLGKTTVATYGAQAANQVGQLWISYVIELYKPISQRQNGGDAENAFISLFPGSSPGVNTFGSGPYLGLTNRVNWDSIGLTLTQSVTPAVTFPVGALGYYIVTIAYFTNPAPIAMANQPGTVTVINGAVVTDFWDNGGAPFAGGPCAVTSQNNSFSFFVLIPDPERQCVINWDRATWSLPSYNAGSDVANLFVAQCYSGAFGFAKGDVDEEKEVHTLRDQVAEMRDVFARLAANPHIARILEQEFKGDEEDADADDEEYEQPTGEDELPIDEAGRIVDRRAERLAVQLALVESSQVSPREITPGVKTVKRREKTPKT